MNPERIFPTLPSTIEERLGAEDDRSLWEEVLRIVAEDASVLLVKGEGSSLYATIGTCSHWFRPHQTRWTAAGGFAAPIGYGKGKILRRGLPDLDWSILLQFNHAEPGWVSPENAPGKHFDSVRLAIPSRTQRHRKAAVHALWSPGTLDAKGTKIVFYGFRKREDGWKFAARSKDLAAR
jgi:hypothetical protein